MDKIISIDELLKILEGYSHKELHLHHTWRPDHKTYFNKPDPLYWQEAMRRFHIETNGWKDIGQHVTLLPDGRFVTGRDFNKTPASIKGHNANAFAVEMIGDFDIGKDPFDGPQKESALKLARWFDQRGKYIRFHNEDSSKTCPGTSINKTDFMNEVRNVTPVLRRGSKGEEVKVLQEKLKKLGYYTGEIDGSYGPQTESAVKAFQKDQKLEQDGVFGPKTRSTLEAVMKQLESETGSALPVLRRGDKGEEVKVLQEKLKKLGYYTGEIDGSYGPQTESAVKAFQKDQKLEQDGVFGPKTRTALEAALKEHESDTDSVIKRLDELESMTKQIMEEINSIRKSISK